MPALTAEQRIDFVRSLWETFRKTHGIRRDIRPDEYHLAYKLAHCGVPLATVLQGIHETGGKPRTLMACNAAIEQNIARWTSAISGLSELPAAGPLEGR